MAQPFVLGQLIRSEKSPLQMSALLVKKQIKIPKRTFQVDLHVCQINSNQRAGKFRKSTRTCAPKFSTGTGTVPGYYFKKIGGIRILNLRVVGGGGSKNAVLFLAVQKSQNL